MYYRYGWLNFASAANREISQEAILFGGGTPVSEKTIILPERDEMERRLHKVDDNPHMVERLYPVLLSSNEQELNSWGVANMLMLAMFNYAAHLPQSAQEPLYARIPEFIDALVDDTEVAEQAKSHLEELHEMI